MHRFAFLRFVCLGYFTTVSIGFRFILRSPIRFGAAPPFSAGSARSWYTIRHTIEHAPFLPDWQDGLPFPADISTAEAVIPDQVIAPGIG
jgi:hypothetical protein